MASKLLLGPNGSLSLTEYESKVFKLILECCEFFKLKTTVRVAGGWVRDKLLGLDSHDLDFALDDCTGKQFAEHFHTYLHEHAGLSTRAGQLSSHVGVIQANPEQSKHLETATLQVLGEWLDFVHLRCEEYAENSRIPTLTRIGTVLEDSHRRDLTINAMYYNVNKSCIEDPTNLGLEDLANGHIRTPLPARQTFLDDPLRVLRAVRFASRFHFDIVPELHGAAMDEEVQFALKDKVSRERIGKEFDGLVRNKRAHSVAYGIQTLHYWHLYPTVMDWPPAAEPGPLQSIVESWSVSHAAGHWLDSGYSRLDDDQRRALLYAAVMHPWMHYTYVDARNKTIPIVSFVCLHSLKLSAKDDQNVRAVCAGAWDFRSLVETLDSQPGRVETGKLLRRMGPLWPAALDLAMCRHIAEQTYEPLCTQVAAYHDVEYVAHERVVHCDSPHKAPSERIGYSPQWEGNPIISELCSKYQSLGSYIISDLDLDGVWSMKPMVNGNELRKALGAEPGPWMSAMLDMMIEFQLDNPDCTKDDCMKWALEAGPKFLEEHPELMKIRSEQ